MGTVIMVLIILITICVDMSLYHTFHIDYIVLGYSYSIPLGLMNIMSFLNIIILVFKRKYKEKVLSDHLIDDDD